MDTIEYPHMVKAINQHNCSSCGKIIKVSETYEKATYKDGEIYAWRICERCKPYVDEAFNNPDYDFSDGMTEHDFHNYMYEEHRSVAKKWWGG